MDIPVIPQENNLAAEAPQQLAKKPSHNHGGEILLLEGEVHPQAFANGRDRKCGQSGYSVVLVTVADNRGPSPGRPRSSPRRDEQKPALVNEDEMGTKFSRFFLSPATSAASTLRWLPRPAVWPCALALGKTIPPGGGSPRHSWDDTLHQTLGGSRRQSASASTGRWESRTPWPLPTEYPTAVRTRTPEVSADAPVPAWHPMRGGRSRLRSVPIGTRKRTMCRPVWRPRRWSCLSSGTPAPFSAVFLTFLRNHVVSCIVLSAESLHYFTEIQ